MKVKRVPPRVIEHQTERTLVYFSYLVYDEVKKSRMSKFCFSYRKQKRRDETISLNLRL